MIYATVADMLARFKHAELVALTDPEENVTLRTARIETALADARALADGYLARAYKLPLAGCAKPVAVPGNAPDRVPPPQLTRIVCDIARYYLYDELAPDHEVYRRFTRARDELQAIASAGALLACPWGGEAGELLATDAVRWHFSPRAITDGVSGSYA